MQQFPFGQAEAVSVQPGLELGAFGTCVYGERTLFACDSSVCHKVVFAVRQVKLHPVVLVLQLCSGHNLGIHVVVILVVDIEGEAVHLVGERVGVLHVVVVDEAQRYAVQTRVEVFKDALARG